MPKGSLWLFDTYNQKNKYFLENGNEIIEYLLKERKPFSKYLNELIIDPNYKYKDWCSLTIWN